jgi:hypothetical protein
MQQVVNMLWHDPENVQSSNAISHESGSSVACFYMATVMQTCGCAFEHFFALRSTLMPPSTGCNSKVRTLHRDKPNGGIDPFAEETIMKKTLQRFRIL